MSSVLFSRNQSFYLFSQFLRICSRKSRGRYRYMNSGFSGTKGTVLNRDVSVNKGLTVIVLSLDETMIHFRE